MKKEHPPKHWDFFISHAREDKEAIARPLAAALKRARCKVWIDDVKISPGVSLRATVEEGIAGSRCGVVILSPEYLSKDWTVREFYGLAAAEETGQMLVVPVRHGVTKERVAARLPMLADKVAVDSVNSADNIENVAAQLVHALEAFDGSSDRQKVGITPAVRPRRTITHRWLLVASVLAAAVFVGILVVWDGRIVGLNGNESVTTSGAGTRERKLVGRVIDSITLKPIPNAQLSLDAGDIPRVDYTDSEGGFHFYVPASVTIVRLRVEHKLYELHDRRVDMTTASGMESIRLTAIAAKTQP